MLLSLFSCFDPCTLSSVWSWNWVFALLTFVSFSCVVQVFPLLLGGFLGKSFRSYWEVLSVFNWVSEGIPILFSTFFLIFMFGVVGLTPYCFAMSSHLVFTFSLSLPLWVGGVWHSLSSSGFNKVVSHFLPLGSPVALWPFLVLVESVSVLIRPFTLSVRLMANVMAGHLILSLIGSGFSSGFFFSPILLGGFLFFEVCVCVVQAYVFVTLLSLYWDE